jgi:hypothetical protein
VDQSLSFLAHSGIRYVAAGGRRVSDESEEWEIDDQDLEPEGDTDDLVGDTEDDADLWQEAQEPPTVTPAGEDKPAERLHSVLGRW